MKKLIALTAALVAASNLIGVSMPSLAATAKTPVKTAAKAKAAPAKAKKAPVAASKYECAQCHMQYSAADAKKYNFKDPMDGGKLVPVAPSAKAAAPSMKM